MTYEHKPVLLKETIEGLNIRENGIYVDCTTGGAGHSSEILKRLDDGRLICIDRDLEAIEKAREVLKNDPRVSFIHDNYSNIEKILDDLNIEKIDGALLDIGVSSYQLDKKERGFSYHEDAPLDMRMDQTQTFTARDLVNTYSVEELEDILWKYGEEKWGRRIALFICQDREKSPIETTGQLVEIIKKAIPKDARQEGHPARKTFQAIRIEVNGELKILEDSLRSLADLTEKGGRICAISFHSLEDRIIKNTFKDLATDCICPPDFPVCVCDHRRKVKLINKKPITASLEEVEENRRARSAKLRIVERV